MCYRIEKREVSRTGELPGFLARKYGWGDRQGTVRRQLWCLVEEGAVLAECRSRAIAQQLAQRLNATAGAGGT